MMRRVLELRMLAQHHAYADVLRALGLEVEVLDPLPGFPDAYLLVSERFADRPELRAFRRSVVDVTEEPACNTLLVNGTLLTRAGFPKARRVLDETGLPVIELDLTEARKMDGGLSCMS